MRSAKKTYFPELERLCEEEQRAGELLNMLLILGAISAVALLLDYLSPGRPF